MTSPHDPSPEKNGDHSPTKEKEIAQQITEEAPEVFKNMPKDKKATLLKAVTKVTVSRMHIGPLPDPETLAAYSNLIPDGANRIMVMAEKEQAHAHLMDKKSLAIKKWMGFIGQIFGFCIGMTVVVGGIFLIYNGFQGWGTTVSLGGLTGLVAVFVYGSRDRKIKQEASKNK